MTPPPVAPAPLSIPDTSRSGWNKQDMMRGSNKGAVPLTPGQVAAPMQAAPSMATDPLQNMRQQEKNAQAEKAKERIGYEVSDKLGKAASAPAGKSGDKLREEAKATIEQVADSGLDVLEIIEAFISGFAGMQSQTIAKRVGEKQTKQREKEAETQYQRELAGQKEIEAQRAQYNKELEAQRINADRQRLASMQGLGATPEQTAALLAVQGKL
jgi:hypothetical protein